MKTHKHLIIKQIDWLQLMLKPSLKNTREFSKLLTVKNLEIRSRHFNKIEEVFKGSHKIATISSEPHSGIIDKSFSMVKFDNKFLYQENLKDSVDEFINDNGYELNNITRIDLAADFNKFLNGIHPKKFIGDFLENKIKKSGRAKYKSAGAYKELKHDDKYKLIGMHHGLKDTKNEHQYLGFGVRTSPVNYYLYNKTRELNDVKMKPWIVESWAKCGLNANDVWRLEFSLKQFTRTMFSCLDGAEINNTTEVLHPQIYCGLFNQMVEDYFVFFSGNGSRADRKGLDMLNLFDHENNLIESVKFGPSKESGRSERIFIKKLHEINTDLRGDDPDNSIYRDKLLYDLVKMHDLERWAENKGIITNKILESFVNLSTKKAEEIQKIIENEISKYSIDIKPNLKTGINK